MGYWNDSLLVGDSMIDDQHRKLVGSIEKLMDACKNGKAKDEIGRLLNYTVTLIKEHFRDEENLQERCAFPGLATHKRLHAQFIMSIDTLHNEFKQTGPNVAMTGKLSVALADWFINHIVAEDKKVGEYIHKSSGK